ncbi:MAG TPA: ATP-binding protein [Symbiobacteriaceae bacterium]|jgi:signal transduction histidine kinase
MPRKLSIQFMAGITLTLLLMLSANLVLVWRQQQQDLVTEMHTKAQVMTDELIATRLFIARSQDKINSDQAGHFEFKGLNPAAVGRGVGEIFGEMTGMRLKQTRFQVRRPENAPDGFDWEAMMKFTDDPKLVEFYKQIVENGKPVFRFAVPLRIEKECLACHGGPAGELDIAGYPKEGYTEGQLGGAITVTLPMDDAIARIRHNAVAQIWMIVAITLVSLLVIYGLSRVLVTHPLERLAAVAIRIGKGNLDIRPGELKALKGSRELDVVAGEIELMARSLRELYNDLEAKVAERTRELEQANQLQGQFLATVSHELRTPLTSIIAFTELLLKQAEGQQQEYLEDVLDSSRRLLAMVNDLLDLSRLEAGRVQLFTDVADVPELLVGIESALRLLAGQKQIALNVERLDGLPLVMVDPLRVKQVFMNLVGNAIKFTPAGGSVTVSARSVPGWVEVSVRDTGPGVPAEHRDAIFEAFRRIEIPGRQHPGSGLGLALSRNLVELHGGRLWVDDAPGGGSTFTFTLPVASLGSTEEEESPHAGDQKDPGGR